MSTPDQSQAPFGTLLVANRGEIALRVIRAARDLEIKTIAVFGDGEQDAMHVRFANDAWRIPSEAAVPYLDIPAILDVARRAGADAVHPGYGFLAENASFARACVEAGLIFVGPTPEAIAAMGDKIEARRIALAAGVPVVPGSEGPVESVTDALDWGARHGYPIAVKAAGGGGGRGFRVARRAGEMETAFVGAASEAVRSFANPEVYLERYLENPRHIEVQIMADSHGNVVAVGNRDCSVQRRHQKLLEEAPAPGLPESTRRAVAAAAVSLARAVDYVGAGTAEFLLDSDGTFAFLEMNTRIQVEHPVTEMTTGIDLVREQLRVAWGAPLSFGPDDVQPRGHAIECRINAEDPGRGFKPVPGIVTQFHPPAGMGIRVDTTAESGSAILPAYDSLIAKVIAWGRDRDESIQRLRGALIELEVEGPPTTREFHLRVLENPVWLAGLATTTFLDHHPDVIPPPVDVGDRVLPRPRRPVEIVAEIDGRRFKVRLPGELSRVSVAGTARKPAPSPQFETHQTARDGAILASPIQGTVVRVLVSPSDVIHHGETVCVVEAMKMENEVTAHRGGTIARLLAAPGSNVRIGDPIAEIV